MQLLQQLTGRARVSPRGSSTKDTAWSWWRRAFAWVVGLTAWASSTRSRAAFASPLGQRHEDQRSVLHSWPGRRGCMVYRHREQP